MDYELFVQVYFGLVVCSLAAGHALAVLSAIQAFCEPAAEPTLMTEMSVLRETTCDGEANRCVEHAGYFEDDYGDSGDVQAPGELGDPDTGDCRNNTSDLVDGQLREDDDPCNPEAHVTDETTI